jgi:hypothetical protein
MESRRETNTIWKGADTSLAKKRKCKKKRKKKVFCVEAACQCPHGGLPIAEIENVEIHIYIEVALFFGSTPMGSRPRNKKVFTAATAPTLDVSMWWSSLVNLLRHLMVCHFSQKSDRCQSWWGWAKTKSKGLVRKFDASFYPNPCGRH